MVEPFQKGQNYYPTAFKVTIFFPYVELIFEYFLYIYELKKQVNLLV